MLHESLSKHLHKPVATGDVESQLITDPDSSPTQAGTAKWDCSLTIHSMAQESEDGQAPTFTAGDYFLTKKEAEQAAAHAAVQYFWPDAAASADVMHQAFIEEHPEVLAGAQADGDEDAPPAKRQKVSGTPTEVALATGGPKSALNHGAQVLKEGTLEKGEIEYKLSPVQGENGETLYVGSVLVKPHSEDMWFEGVPHADKKQAENNAAEAALAELGDMIEEKEAERKEIRRQKEEARLALRKPDERRLDVDNTGPFTLKQFVEFYGGTLASGPGKDRYDEATPVDEEVEGETGEEASG
jgi:hypothetical protein